MVYAGDVSLNVYQDSFILTATGFDANSEFTERFPIHEHFPFIPSHYTMNVKRTAGLTDAVNVRARLYPLDENVNQDILICTSSAAGHANSCKSTTIDYTGAAMPFPPNYLRLIILVVTVGAGNTLTVTIVGRK